MPASPTTVEIFEDLSQLTRRAAEIFVQTSNQALATRERFTVVLSGGRTPEDLYRLLADAAQYRDQIPWRSSHFFWGDERCVPPSHPDSNFRMAFSSMLSKVDLPPENVHRIRSELPSSEAAQDYEDELRRFFSIGAGQSPNFDLVLLGLGADGHTASLFPGSEAVREKNRLVVAPWIAKLSSFRITLTPPAFNGAERVTFLVSGADKAAALQAVLEGEPDPERLPAQAIQPSQGSLVWLADRPAASRLQRH
jgi:6-phosphogluconolactonase